MSNPKFTITLGRSGQRVVKDSRGDSDGIRASKRSIPGNGGDNALNNTKRMRNDMSGRGYNFSSPIDSCLDPKDLRSKLTLKRFTREMELQKVERKKMELFEKVSKAIRSVEPPKDKLGRSAPSSREAAEKPKMGSGVSPYASRPSNEPDDLKLYRSHSTRDATETPKVAEFSTPFVSWPSNGTGTGFTERIPPPYSGVSTPRSAIDELPQLPSLRPKTDGWPNTPLGSSRPNIPMPPASRCPPAGGGISLPPLQEGQPLTVSSLLRSLGLGKYYINFQAEEIDMTILKQMGEADLKELGIPMGPRKKIFLSVQEIRAKRPVTQPQRNYLQNS